MPLESHDRDIFAIAGIAPEVQAVAFAKYSRSQESVKTVLADLTNEKSAEFHEKWVIGYGDASVADMAQVAIAMENVSIVVSKALEDHRLASYQEKSSRYVPFDPTRYHKPEVFMADPELAAEYTSAVEKLLNGYVKLTDGMIEYYGRQYPRPEEIPEKIYANKLRARALDVARYAMPICTLTNLGFVASARELRYIISKLAASPYGEVRAVAAEIKRAALEPAYNPTKNKVDPLLIQLSELGTPDQVVEELREAMNLSVAGAPTLIKHTEPREYLNKKDKFAKIAAMFLGDEAPPYEEPRVDLVTGLSPEDELITGLLYPHTTISLREISERVAKLTTAQKQTLIATINSERGQYDNLSREFEVGNFFLFDTLMDFGAFCDLQRHRLTSQLNQPITPMHGFEVPRDLTEAGLLPLYQELMEANATSYYKLAAINPDEARYLLAKAWRKRTLFKMNLRELYHLVELRTKSGGHFSYRALAYEMYEKTRAEHPLLVEHLRPVKMNFDADFFGR